MDLPVRFDKYPKKTEEKARQNDWYRVVLVCWCAEGSLGNLSHAPEMLAEWTLGLSQYPLIILFLINILLFIVGMFLDVGPAIIILGPILAPVFIGLGVHPVHFAMIMSVNLTVGLAAPPMGLVLFVTSQVSGEKVQTISKAILPFLAVEVLVIFVITYIPAISMTVPRWAGFVQ